MLKLVCSCSGEHHSYKTSVFVEAPAPSFRTRAQGDGALGVGDRPGQREARPEEHAQGPERGPEVPRGHEGEVQRERQGVRGQPSASRSGSVLLEIAENQISATPRNSSTGTYRKSFSPRTNTFRACSSSVEKREWASVSKGLLPARARRFEQRKKDREEEILAIGDALKILTEDSARDLFSSSLGFTQARRAARVAV